MRLDFEPSNGNFIIHSERGPGDEKVTELMQGYGLDYWPTASNTKVAVFSTKCAYTASPFWEYANERAQAHPVLSWIAKEVEASRATTSLRSFSVPADKELSDYQKADLAYMLDRPGRVLDADEPGLGKTMTAIAYCNEVRAKKVLIVVPAHLRYQWLARYDEWTTLEEYDAGRVHRAQAIRTAKGGLDEGATIYTISYDLIGKPGLHEALMKQHFDVIIADEAHALKTPSSVRTKALYGGNLAARGKEARETEGLASVADHVIELTGTPLPNRPLEAWVHAINLAPESIGWMSQTQFSERFNPIKGGEAIVWDADTGKPQRKFWQDERSGREAELQARMRAHFMTRHLKREVLTQLKLPKYELVQAEITPEVGLALQHEREGLERISTKLGIDASSLLDLDPELVLSNRDPEIMGHIAAARQEMGIALVPQMAEHVEYLLDAGVDKLVVFYWHIEVGNRLEALLADHGVCRVDGSCTSRVKEERKAQFIADPRKRVLLGNILTLGTGTDGLQDVSSYCFIAEPDWTPGNNVQCVDRLDRRGQTQTVNADILVAPGSVVEHVLGSALRKAHVTHNALDRRVA